MTIHKLKKESKTTNKTEYIIIHGVKKVSERREESFTDWDMATSFFKEKEKEGVHVNMIKKTTKIITNTEVIA